MTRACPREPTPAATAPAESTSAPTKESAK